MVDIDEGTKEITKDITEEAIELREKLEKEFEEVVVTGETIETVKMRPAGRSSSFLNILSTATGYEADVVDIVIDEDGNERMRIGSEKLKVVL